MEKHCLLAISDRLNLGFRLLHRITVGQKMKNWDYSAFKVNIRYDCPFKKNTNNEHTLKESLAFQVKQCVCGDCQREWSEVSLMLLPAFILSFRSGGS